VDDPETKSPDVVAKNVEQLKALFPEAFTEGKVAASCQNGRSPSRERDSLAGNRLETKTADGSHSTLP